MGVNSVTLVGRAGRDPEVRYFESGSMGWHGKGTNERPETAIIMEDPDGNHGFVMAMTDCVGGGDAFGRATFECSQENKCLVSYYIKGRAWQGFSESYPGNHIWTAAPDNNYPGVHLQTVHDTGNWHRKTVMLSQFDRLRTISLKGASPFQTWITFSRWTRATSSTAMPAPRSATCT